MQHRLVPLVFSSLCFPTPNTQRYSSQQVCSRQFATDVSGFQSLRVGYHPHGAQQPTSAPRRAGEWTASTGRDKKKSCEVFRDFGGRRLKRRRRAQLDALQESPGKERGEGPKQDSLL
ncbi:unnamed protein product [Boreogadus saida]